MSEDAEQLKAFQEFLVEQQRWASLFVSVQEISDELPSLVRQLSKYSFAEAVPLIAGLLTLRRYQSQCLRLEVLVLLAATHCSGKKRVGVSQLAKWFTEIGKSRCASGEDAAEDLFVSLVHGSAGDYRIVEGLWESAGFYTQRFLDIVQSMPERGELLKIRRSTIALLRVSDLVCEKARLRRYQIGSDKNHNRLKLEKLPSLSKLSDRVRISGKELASIGVSLQDLSPFLLDTSNRARFLNQRVGESELDRYPMFEDEKSGIVVALPTAISGAFRDFVIETLIKLGQADRLTNNLATLYSELFYNTSLLGGPIRRLVEWNSIGPHKISQFELEIDHGYYVTFHLFLPSITSHFPGGLKNIYRDEGGVITTAVQESIDETMQRLGKNKGFKEGLVLIVSCGWGKGIATEQLEVDHPSWRTLVLSAPDLITASSLKEMNPTYFWKLQDAVEAAELGGVFVRNVNGLLNLIGWVRDNDGHIVPHSELEGTISPQHPLDLVIPLNLLRNVRASVHDARDTHSAQSPDGAWHQVQRISPNPIFQDEGLRRMYASIDDANSGKLTSLYEHELTVWHTISTPNLTDRSLIHRLWEMVNQWLYRTAVFVESSIELSEKVSIHIFVEFLDFDPPSTPEKHVPNEEELQAKLKISQIEGKTTSYKLVVQIGFLAGFANPENIGERLITQHIYKIIHEHVNQQTLSLRSETVARQIMKNSTARSFHILHAHSYVDFVRDTLPTDLITINELDDAAAKIGLVKAIDSGNEKTRKVTGKADCSKLLNDVVDSLIADLRKSLSAFNRETTLCRLIENHEKAGAEEEHWQRTSAALIGLYGNTPELRETSAEQISRFAGASITSRILIEIALCECPLNDGADISGIELSKLVAKAALLIRLGGLSDAIHFNALPPELTISPLGDILFKDNFGEFVVQPLLVRAISDGFVKSADRFSKYYAEPSTKNNIKDDVDSSFWDIWNLETGFTLDEAREIIDAIENYGIENNTLHIQMSKNEFFQKTKTVKRQAVASFLEQFTLRTRPNWAKPPDGFELKEIYPWKYGRRLSYVARSILEIDNNANPTLIVAPTALRRGFRYLFDGAYYGKLPQHFFSTAQMKNTWWGQAGSGHQFNLDVEQFLQENGWQVRSNIELPELLQTKLEKDYGDIDVLAWQSDTGTVLVIECKDLSLARNYSEIASLLSEYQGVQGNGKSDSLGKHLSRFSIVVENSSKVEEFLKLSKSHFVSCLVCRGPVPMQYASIEALSGTYVGNIEEVVATVTESIPNDSD